MPKITISYRRADSDAIAGRIRDRLAGHYGEASVFMDIDNIPFGIDFREHIKTELAQTDVLVAVVGPKWLGRPGEGGRMRIAEESDPVRIEIETALQRGIPVVPVLVHGATIPSTGELPDSIKSFAFYNAAEVDTGRDFHPHMDRLIRSMDRVTERQRQRPHGRRAGAGWSADWRQRLRRAHRRRRLVLPEPRLVATDAAGTAAGRRHGACAGATAARAGSNPQPASPQPPTAVRATPPPPPAPAPRVRKIRPGRPIPIFRQPSFARPSTSS